MGLKLKYFTLVEAESLLPKITEVLHSALEIKDRIEKKVDEWRRKQKSLPPAEEAMFRGQVDFMATQLESQLNRISELGCVPKDLEMGLVDFASRIKGQEAFLCWKLGENKIKYWHGLTEGYQGRKPLDEDDRS